MTGLLGPDGVRGVALVAALWLVLLLSALGLGLALTAGLEPAIAANVQRGLAATNAAESALVMAAHDLAELGDWTQALSGTWSPSSLSPAAGDDLLLPDNTHVSLAALTNLANCGHVDPCTRAESRAVTIDRPWGTNNPQWRVAGLNRLDHLVPELSGHPIQTVVWVGDDPSEIDGDALLDGGPFPGGSDETFHGRAAVVLRSESFGVRGAHALLCWHVSRPEPGWKLRLHPWLIR